jgi:hypothetical protein
MIESMVESLHFASNEPNLTTVTDDDNIQGCNDDNDDSIQRSGEDIEMVDR